MERYCCICERDDSGEYVKVIDVLLLLNKLKDSIFVDGMDKSTFEIYKCVHSAILELKS